MTQVSYVQSGVSDALPGKAPTTLTRMIGQKLIFQALMMAASESAPLMTAMAATAQTERVSGQ